MAKRLGGSADVILQLRFSVEAWATIARDPTAEAVEADQGLRRESAVLRLAAAGREEF